MELWTTEINKKKSGKYRQDMVSVLVTVLLILASVGTGGYLILRELLETVPGMPFLAGVLIGCVLCLGLLSGQRKCAIGSSAFLAGVLIAGIFFWKQILHGGISCWDELADTLGSRAGIYLTRYGTSAETGDRELIFFFLFLGIVMGLAGTLVSRMRLTVIVVLWALVLPVCMFYLQKFPDLKTGLVFYTGVILELNEMMPGKKDRVQMGKRGSVLVWGILFSIVVVAVSVSAMGLIAPEKDYSSSELVKNAGKEITDKIEEIRYKRGVVNSLPNGKLKEVGSWKGSEDTALSVTMEHPDSLYLKGFTGSVYDGNQWKSVSTETAYGEKNLFYWLHQDRFYGETQLASIRNLVKDDSLSSTEGTVSVENEKADSRYVYLPYETQELPENYRGITGTADSMLNARGLFGDRKYSFTSLGDLVKDFTALGAESYQVLSEQPDSTYRQQESYYNSFVYQQDTVIPDNLTTLFEKELGNGGDRNQGHTDYYTAISRIRSYLEDNMTYSTATDVYSGTGDFAENFLTESKIGHSVHYATAAALMFRYYGIPSRYVEGYLVTPEDVKDKKDGDKIDIPGKNGHAWTEIYIDGMGWVPVEMTPEYYGVMEEPDLTLGLEAEGARTAPIPETETEQNENTPEINTHWNLQIAVTGLVKFILLLLLVFDIFGICFLVTVCILRAVANIRRKRAFHSQDRRLAVRAMAGYAGRLYEQGNFDEKLSGEFQNTWRTGQKAAFSPHEISSEERQEVEECVKALKKELLKNTGWYDRWVMKYIERLY